jgi:hypothetical protein
MSAILLSALFITSGLLAVAAMAVTWQRYGRAALALRTELGACAEWREVGIRISEVRVRTNAIVLRPNFTRPSAPLLGLAALPAVA